MDLLERLSNPRVEALLQVLTAANGSNSLATTATPPESLRMGGANSEASEMPSSRC